MPAEGSVSISIVPGLNRRLPEASLICTSEPCPDEMKIVEIRASALRPSEDGSRDGGPAIEIGVIVMLPPLAGEPDQAQSAGGATDRASISKAQLPPAPIVITFWFDW